MRKSKIGLVPIDWKVLKLEDIADVKGGKRLPKGYSLQEEPNGYPYITVSDMFYGGISTDNLKYVPVKIVDRIKNYRVSKEDLFISVAGTLGIVGKVPDSLNNANLTENADKLTNIKIDKEYLYQVLISDIIQKEIKKEKTVNAQPKLALARIKNFNIPVPSSEKEISKIASILSTWDKAIELKEKLIEQKKEQKKGLMQKLLTGEVRLLGFDGEWDEEILQNVATIIMGQSPPSSSYNENQSGFPLIQGNNDCKNRKTSANIWTSKPTKMCQIGDIIMTVRAPVGVISRSVHEACIGRGVCAIRSNIRKINQDFLYYQLISMEHKWGRISQGSTFESINSNDIKGLKINLPSIEEQIAISNILLRHDQELSLLERELNAFKQQKKGLMQQLLTGKVRVKV
jgi:type I restriction enzyme S subunit